MQERRKWAGVPFLGFLASPSLTSGGGGLLAGNAELLLVGKRRCCCRPTSIGATTVLLLAIDRVLGLRVTAEEEDLGLDLTHGCVGMMGR